MTTSSDLVQNKDQLTRKKLLPLAVLLSLCVLLLCFYFHIADHLSNVITPITPQDHVVTTVPQPSANRSLVRPPYLYLTADKWGRLGNQMFQYASLLGIADINAGSHKMVYPRDSLVERAFQLTHLNNKKSKGFKAIGEAGSGTYDAKFKKLPPKNVTVMGYLQSWKYFHHVESVIRKEFTFLPNIRNRDEQMLKKLTQGKGKVTVVGIHVRRGDYVRPKKVGEFKLPPHSYFRKAADFFRAKHRDVLFIVVTTDPVWCQQLLKMNNFVLSDQATPAEHLALLTLCDHVIMSIGSFGWWAGYLSGGDVVYYNNCISPNMTAKKGFIPRDHFRPNWIGIGD